MKTIITDINIINILLFNIFVIRNYHSEYKFGNIIDIDEYNKSTNNIISQFALCFLICAMFNILFSTVLLFINKITLVSFVAYLLFSSIVIFVFCYFSYRSVINKFVTSTLKDFPKNNQIISSFKFKFNDHQTKTLFDLSDNVSEVIVSFGHRSAFDIFNILATELFGIYSTDLLKSFCFDYLKCKVTAYFTKINKNDNYIINIGNNNNLEKDYLRHILKYCSGDALLKLRGMNKNMKNIVSIGKHNDKIISAAKNKLNLTNDISFEYLFATTLLDLKPTFVTSHNIYRELHKSYLNAQYVNNDGVNNDAFREIQKYMRTGQYISTYSNLYAITTYFRFNGNTLETFDESVFNTNKNNLQKISDEFEKTITFKTLNNATA